MLFNSNFFLYLFLPSLLLLYVLLPYLLSRFLSNANKEYIAYRNVVLLLYSLLFYLFTSGIYILVLFLIVIGTYFAAIFMQNTRPKVSKATLLSGILLNLGCLFYFKYSGFMCENINYVMSCFTGSSPNWASDVVLPVGISFYVFQALSYLLDVRGGDTHPKEIS